LAVRRERPRARRQTPPIGPIERRKGVLFIGSVEGGSGLGQCLRNDLLAAVHADLPFAIYPFNVEETRRIPVPYTLRPVEPYEFFWPEEGQVWADPDLKAAAEIFRQVFEAPALAIRRAKTGKC
jgi:hypothetical protein